MANKEYIERDALLSKQYESEGHCGLSTKVVDVRDIEDEPAADVAPVVRAEWEIAPKPAQVGFVRWPYRCSVCKIPLVALEPDQAPYCHCGAKMKEEVK